MKKIKNGQINSNNINQKVTLYGFVANKRKMSDKLFVDLRDDSGIVQLVLTSEIKKLTKESVLEVHGVVKERQNKNPKIPTGEIEIIVENLTVLSAAKHELPFNIHDDINAKDDTRLKYRYLDLRRPIMQNKFRFRHKLIHEMRNFLEKEDFIEIETPYLSKSTPEGARDFLVPTRHQGHFFALPQSPQLYKQILMGSGFEKYFQVVRAFRDEDNRKDRGPEFTQLDLEMTYVNEQDIQDLIEKMLISVLQKLNINIKSPFLRIDYNEAIDKYGLDKPDLRFKNLLIELTPYFKNSSLDFLKNAPSIKGLVIEQNLSAQQIKHLEVIAKQNEAKGIIWANFDSQKTGTGWKLCAKELLNISKELKITQGTIILVGDQYSITTKTLGAIRNKLQEMFNLANNNQFVFAWVENFPLFEHDALSKRFVAAHHPFTSPEVKMIDNFEKHLETVKARAYDLVCNGFEIGGGSIRINDLQTQLKMFEAIGLKFDEVQARFGFFLELFKYGLPPHGGIALGIDRLTMILTHSESLREVIAFPKNANGIAVMEEAPTQISSKQLDEYFITIKNINNKK